MGIKKNLNKIIQIVKSHLFFSHGNSPHIGGFPPKWIADPPKMAGGSS